MSACPIRTSARTLLYKQRGRALFSLEISQRQCNCPPWQAPLPARKKSRKSIGQPLRPELLTSGFLKSESQREGVASVGTAHALNDTRAIRCGFQ